MAKIGRNDLCPCGSGKKYKKCCLASDEEVARLALAAAAVAAANDPDFSDEAYDEMAAASNAVIELINAGKLDEAEHAARELLERFANVCDGHARLGLVHELRGDNHQAIECYRQVIAIARRHPNINEPVLAEDFQALIERLEHSMTDPPAHLPS
jgi:tetratricopeptide (TPR) repeat protein